MHFEALSLQPAGPKAGTGDQAASTSAPGAPQPQQPAMGGSWVTFLPILMILPVFFLMSRKNKRETEARQKLKKGDQVASTAGLVGELMEIDERFAKVKIGPGITVKMLSSSLSPLDPVVAAAPVSKDKKDDDKSEKSSVKSEKAAASAK